MTSELKLYNTLTRTKEVFTPEDPKNVRMYVCGPTVYDFAHIGNARPVIVFDVLYRLLKHLYPGEGTGVDKRRVTYARNITDVDDKINARALRDYPDLELNDAIGRVTEKTANQFHADVKALGCLKPDFEPRATQHINDMIDMAQKLIDKGHAYVAKGEQGYEVLFDVKAMPNYGALSNRKLEDQKAGARVDVTSHKKNAGDFVLWKQSADNEPGWDAKFTQEGKTIEVRGRPGWHIECSVMSEHHLGKTFDIHGGGLDLIFPHHENEIAQSCCAHGTDKMASVWMHNGYLQVEGKKMSKSDGNFITINELLETEKFGGRKWPGEVLRLAMLMTHYREPIDFSVKRLEEAEKKLAKWFQCVDEIRLSIGLEDDDEHFWTVVDRKMNSYPDHSSVIEIIGNDLALHLMVVYFDGTSADFKNYSDESRKRNTDRWLHFCGILKLLGLSKPTVIASTMNISEEVITSLISDRLDFINDKNWAEADRIRDELLAQGIQLKDGKDPQTGERITTWEVKR